MAAGIYKITCTANGKFYIGRTVDYRKRIRQHMNDMIRHDHKNPIIQGCYDKYGVDSFEFELIEPMDVDSETMIQREQELLDRYIGTENCMNVNRSADVFCDVPFTEERRAKIAMARKGKKGKPKTEEQKLHMHNVMMGHKLSEETKRKISESHKGKKLSEEHKQKLRQYRGEKSYWYGKSGEQVPHSIHVWQVDPKTGKKINRFPNAVEAAKTFGAKDGSYIRKYLKAGKVAYGYLWIEDKECQSTIESTDKTVNE